MYPESRILLLKQVVLFLRYAFFFCRQEASHKVSKWADMVSSNADLPVPFVTAKKDMVNIRKQTPEFVSANRNSKHSFEAYHHDNKSIPKITANSPDDIEDIAPRSMRIEVDNDTGYVVVWRDQDEDKSSDKISHKINHLFSQQEANDRVIGDRTEEETTTDDQVKVSESFLGKESEGSPPLPKVSRAADNQKLTLEGISGPGPMIRKIKNKKEEVEYLTDKVCETSKPLLTLDINALIQNVIKSTDGDKNEHLPPFMMKLALLIIKKLEMEKQDHLLPVQFDFEGYNKVFLPLTDIFLMHEQVLVFHYLTKSIINNLEMNTSTSEYCRRVLVLRSQFEHGKIIENWNTNHKDLPVDVKAISSLLKVEERWPLFLEYDKSHLKCIQEKIASLNEQESLQLETLFFHEHRQRLFIIHSMVEARMRNYTFCFSDTELQDLVKSGYTISLLLKLDLSLELSHEKFNWGELELSKKRTILSSVYLAMKGIREDKKVSYRLLESHWGSSPIRELILSRPKLQERFESRVKLLVTFCRTQPSKGYPNSSDDKKTESWEEQSFNSGEELAALYSGIRFKDLAMLKYMYRLKKVTLKLRNNFSRIQRLLPEAQELERLRIKHSIMYSNNLKCWPERKEDQNMIPGIILEQKHKFIKYYELLDMTFPRSLK